MVQSPAHPSQVSPGLWISGIAGLDQIETLEITHIVVSNSGYGVYDTITEYPLIHKTSKVLHN
jgi:hypothetical protein